jgi:hypothetical protein
MPTANVYVDGFNLFYRCLKGTPHKWLDPAKLASLLLLRLSQGMPVWRCMQLRRSWALYSRLAKVTAVARSFAGTVEGRAGESTRPPKVNRSVRSGIL